MEQIKNLSESMLALLEDELRSPKPLKGPTPADRAMRIYHRYKEDGGEFRSLLEIETYLAGLSDSRLKVEEAYKIILRRLPDPACLQKGLQHLEREGVSRFVLTLCFSEERTGYLVRFPRWKNHRVFRALRRKLSELLARLGFAGLVRISA